EVPVARRLQLCWGVSPLLIEEQTSSTSTFSLAMGMAREMGVLNDGDLVVQTAGTLSGVSGSTDLVRVGIVSAVLGRGLGIGSGSVSGKVRLANSPEEAARLEIGEILVVRETSAAYLEAIRKARGVIAEEQGRQSHAAVIAERLGIPVIVGVTNATLDLRQGEIVTLEVHEGVVHRGAHSPAETVRPSIV
ncbi:MAG: PEP-utilizing enzyme, partial [Synechococcaceae cyanobacterium]|nr:PEP-utilizing enzyme [Synechococcaceae cyanobacterium]